MHVTCAYDYDLVDVHRVVDGDTVDLLIDVGFRLLMTGRFRLVTVDTPERNEAGWREATDFTRLWLETHARSCRVQTHKADSFGRWLADVYIPGGETLSEALLREGHGKPYVRR